MLSILVTQWMKGRYLTCSMLPFSRSYPVTVRLLAWCNE